MAIAVGDVAPKVELEAPDGRRMSFESYRGRRVVLLLLRGLW